MLALGCDHGGYELMQEVKKHLENRGIAYHDFIAAEDRVGRLPDLRQKSGRGCCKRRI